MKMRKYVAMAAIAGLFAYGCSSDDDAIHIEIYDCPSLEASYGDFCIDANGNEGTVDEDCNCLVEPVNYDVIVGKWRSPVPAPILASFVDSIHVEFKNNQTYVVKSFKDGGITELTGVYETADGVGPIRNIVLDQMTPTTLTSQGIYQVDGDNLTYEVAQVEPAQPGVEAPTAEAGFGSTSGGAFGDMNVQHYYKMD